jgi:hypothetical protein
MTTAAGHAAAPELVNLYRWCTKRAAAFRDFEAHEMPLWPTPADRDDELVKWVVRALANPGCAGSAAVLEEIDRSRAMRT